MKKLLLYVLLPDSLFAVAFYFLCGLFFIQSIGAILDSATVGYFRYDTNMSFISSADGMLDQTGAGVSLLGRGIALGAIAKGIEDQKICSLPNSKPFTSSPLVVRNTTDEISRRSETMNSAALILYVQENLILASSC
tara:strand:- start:265 stop:675 length:411 start_codon:yes stop_codon:yes gene_type:complete